MFQSNKKNPNPNQVSQPTSQPEEEHNSAKTASSINAQMEKLDSMLEESGEALSGRVDKLFYLRLLEYVTEGVVFVDADFSINCWNRSAEQMTGLASSNMTSTEFSPSRIGLTTLEGKPVADLNCPVVKAMDSQKQLVEEYSLVGRSGREISVAITVIPIVADQRSQGAILLFRDLSAKMDMKRQLTELYQQCSLDPLTRVANRTEFERTLREYAKAHQAANANCCIIVCDLDYFKKVNDTYGHNVGDQALIAFAQHLNKHIRARDIVARYGGEEFVILCANCDLNSAVDRAEQIRKALNSTPQQMLDGKALAASFGVAELLEGEDITDFFVRADKALYAAKQRGRNRVEMATVGEEEQDNEVLVPEDGGDRSSVSGIEWRKIRGKQIYCEEFRTTAPGTMLANKIRGYILEVDADVRCWEDNYISFTALQIDTHNPSRRSHFRVDIEVVGAPGERADTINYLRIVVFAPRARLFRRSYDELHTMLVADMRRYLMLSDETSCLKLNLAATESGRDE